MASHETKSGWTALAHLLRPQGRRGEILAELLTDFPDRLANGLQVFLAAPGFAGAANDAHSASVSGSWSPTGRNAGRVVIQFAEIDSISLAEPLGGLDVLIPDAELMPLEEDAAYIADLLGCSVFNLAADESELVGQVIAVDFPTTPDGSRRLPDAAPLLTVETRAGDEVLIPYVKAFLVHLDVAGRRMEMRLPEGLVELNRPVEAIQMRDRPS
jgi:16S rRNA processing protein RimM